MRIELTPDPRAFRGALRNRVWYAIAPFAIGMLAFLCGASGLGLFFVCLSAAVVVAAAVCIPILYGQFSRARAGRKWVAADASLQLWRDGACERDLKWDEIERVLPGEFELRVFVRGDTNVYDLPFANRAQSRELWDYWLSLKPIYSRP